MAFLVLAPRPPPLKWPPQARLLPHPRAAFPLGQKLLFSSPGVPSSFSCSSYSCIVLATVIMSGYHFLRVRQVPELALFSLHINFPFYCWAS